MTDERKNAAGREPAACCRLLSELQLERSLVRIVDDNAQTCDSLRFFLESLGFNADTWTDPVRFLTEWREDARPVPVMVGRLATIAQAGAMLDKSERQVRRLIARGGLVSVRIGRRVYVTRSSVIAYAEGLPHGEG